MPVQEKTAMGDRTEWILRLLYAPVNGEEAKPVVGMTRLMKGLFLLDRKLDEKFDVETDFEFEADKYGPLDEKVYEAVDELKRDGLIDVKESDGYDGKEYMLTERGEIEGGKKYKEIPLEQRQLISWLKEKHVFRELSSLLSFVYNQYPKSAEESVLD